MQVMGDWAKGEFTNAGQNAGKEFGGAVLSDHGTAYRIGGDVFAFSHTKSSETLKAQALLQHVMTDPANQVAFSAKKGSIPVRQDGDVASLDVCARKTHEWLLDKSAQAPANELLSPPAITGAVEDLISQCGNDPSMSTDNFISKVVAAVRQP